MDNPAGPGADSPTDPSTANRSVPKPKRFQQAQAQVDEVVDIMRKNIDKVLERDNKLSQLDDRADALQEGASQFEKSAGSLKHKMGWKNLKVMVALAVCAVVLLTVVFVYFSHDNKAAKPARHASSDHKMEHGVIEHNNDNNHGAHAVEPEVGPHHVQDANKPHVAPHSGPKLHPQLAHDSALNKPPPHEVPHGGKLRPHEQR